MNLSLSTLLATCMLLTSIAATAQQDDQPPAPPKVVAGADTAEGEKKPPTCAMPVYPRASLRNEETGTVTLEFLIGANGLVEDSRILKTTGFRDLDLAAQTALSKCRFKPARVDGVATPAWVKVAYTWSLY